MFKSNKLINWSQRQTQWGEGVCVKQMFIFFSLAPAVSAAAVSRPLASQGLHQDVIQKFKWALVLEQRWCSHADKLYLQHQGWGKPLSRPFFLVAEISSVWTSRVFSACFLKVWAWLPTLWWRWLWQVVPVHLGQSPALAEAGEEVDCKDSTLRHLNKGQTQRTLWIEVFVAGEEAKQKQTESLDLKPILCLLAFIPS